MRHSGLGLPTTFYGEPAQLVLAPLNVDFALSVVEVLIRVANEQIKCMCFSEHICKDTKDFWIKNNF